MPANSFDHYTVFGDIGAIAICTVIGILLLSSYVSRTRSFRIFQNILFSIVLAAFINIAYHFLLAKNDPDYYSLIYVFRVLYQVCIFDTFFLLVLYITEVTDMDHKLARKVAIAATALLTVTIGIDVVRSIMGKGFKITPNGAVEDKTNIYIIGYILFVVLIGFLMQKIRQFVFKRVLYGFYAMTAVSVVVRLAQLPMKQSSLTTLTFVFPAISILYVFHSHPYNIKLGSVDTRAMEDMIKNMHDRKREFVFFSLLLPDYNEGKEIPEGIRAQIRRFSAIYFKSAILFQVSKGHVILVASKRRNPDYRERMKRMLEGFDEQYRRFRSPYKIVIGESMEEISRNNEYVSFINNVQRKMPENTVHRISPDDITRFNDDKYVLGELTDIYKKHDIDDPRVLAFCQPVYNIKTGEFDTAEALMRLSLEKTGIVFPDQFIPLAEKYGYIHVMTKIILNKACKEIKRLTEDGFKLARVSVNVSVLELKDDEFCEDIRKIISDNGISGDKIALELTESSSEADFVIMKERIEELRRQGIKFYLDDFGTGYSNMQRIMELPFDIIKFDRSMLIASETGERSERMVGNLAHMFKDLKYSVLYEGVENEFDEERCKGMSASYLQGFKYSRPVPIDKLRDFLPSAG